MTDFTAALLVESSLLSQQSC